jgi:tumor protein p53-inducible protein 3
MKAIVMTEPGEASVLHVGDAPIPVLKEGETLVKMEATAVNRADILQRQGRYPPPKGATDIIGLECSGYIVNEESELENGSYKNNDRVMALLPGGGYGDIVAV